MLKVCRSYWTRVRPSQEPGLEEPTVIRKRVSVSKITEQPWSSVSPHNSQIWLLPGCWCRLWETLKLSSQHLYFPACVCDTQAQECLTPSPASRGRGWWVWAGDSPFPLGSGAPGLSPSAHTSPTFCRCGSVYENLTTSARWQ